MTNPFAHVTFRRVIEYSSDEVIKEISFFWALQRFEYHVSVEQEEKLPKPKFGGNRFMEAQDMAT